MAWRQASPSLQQQARLLLLFAHGNILMMLFMAAVTGRRLAFLFYNFNPCHDLHGNTGSMFLLHLGCYCTADQHQESATVALLTPYLLSATDHGYPPCHVASLRARAIYVQATVNTFIIAYWTLV